MTTTKTRTERISIFFSILSLMKKTLFSKIFELFNRTGYTKMVRGTGVGLFMVKKIVDRHFGQVKLSSQLAV